MSLLKGILKKTKVIISALLLLGVSTNAQDKLITDPHLYAIEKDGSISFILGTIHFGVDMSEFPPFVSDALKMQAIFATEALESKKVSSRHDNSSKLPTTILELLRYRGMEEEDVNSYRPEALCMAYKYLDFLDKDPTNGDVLDSQFERLAIQHDKDLRELDIDKGNIDDAINQLFPPCSLPAFIREFPPLDASDMFNESISVLADEYRLEGEAELNTYGSSESSTLNRNIAWIPLLEDMHGTGFFAVMGAAHLDPFDEKGVLSLFKANGYKVTRVSNLETFNQLTSKY